METEEQRARAVGELIAAGREALRLSVRAAAKEAGISEGRWRQLERGYQQLGSGVQVPARARPETLAKIAVALGTSRDALFEAAGFDPRVTEAYAQDKPRDADFIRDLTEMSFQELVRWLVNNTHQASLIAAEIQRRYEPLRKTPTGPLDRLDPPEFAQGYRTFLVSVGLLPADLDTSGWTPTGHEPGAYDLAARTGTPVQVQRDAAEPDPNQDPDGPEHGA